MKKIAVPITTDNIIVDHFGQSKLYEIYIFSENKEILDVQLLESNQGSGCKSNIANVLAEAGVTALLSGHMGNKAKHRFNTAGINVIRGCKGDSADIVLSFMGNEIIEKDYTCLKYKPKHQNSRNHICNH